MERVKLAKEQARKDQIEQERTASAKRDDGGKKGGKKGSKSRESDWYGDRKKGSNGNEAKGKGKGEGQSETRHCFDCGEQGHIGVNCPYKWTNSTDEEDDQGSPLEK